MSTLLALEIAVTHGEHIGSNLIDISQTTQPLDGQDAQQREGEHK